jgi:hypothetical protein
MSQQAVDKVARSFRKLAARRSREAALQAEARAGVQEGTQPFDPPLAADAELRPSAPSIGYREFLSVLRALARRERIGAKKR